MGSIQCLFMTHWCVVQLGTPDRTKFYRGTWTKVKIKRLFLNCWCLLVPRPVTAGHVRDSQSCESITMEMDCLCPVMLWGLQGWASLQRTFVFIWRLWTFDRTAPHYSPHTPLVSWGVFQVLVDKTPRITATEILDNRARFHLKSRPVERSGICCTDPSQGRHRV